MLRALALRFRTSRFLQLVAAALLVAAGMAGYLVWQHKNAPYHFRVVEKGVLYRSGTLKPEHLEQVIRTHGIRTVVNLRSDYEKGKGTWFADEQRVCAANGVHLVDLGCDYNAPMDAAKLARWRAILHDPSCWPILVHCEHGVIRTNMAVAVYYMERLGRGNEDTLNALPLFGHKQHENMVKFIREYVPHGGSVPAGR
jgi:protein tyrosine/serine phosphatase